MDLRGPGTLRSPHAIFLLPHLYPDLFGDIARLVGDRVEPLLA